MQKQVFRSISITVVLLLSFMFFTACSSKDKECTAEDYQTACADKAGFDIVGCSEEGTCKYAQQKDICGNDICEETNDEDGCSCPDDCKPCEGKVAVGQYGKTTKYAEYVQHYCDAKETCTLGVNPEDVRPLTLYEEKQFSYFTLGVTTTYNIPIEVASDKIQLKFELLEANEKIQLPITITTIQVLGGSVLYGQATASKALDTVGSSATVQIPITYSLKVVEETAKLTIKINYEYTINGKTERSSFEKPFSQGIVLVDPSLGE